MGERFRILRILAAADRESEFAHEFVTLPEAFARDAERLARFDHGARVLASLNHPGIAAIYGLEQTDGVPFLVLEYVPGETLRSPISHLPRVRRMRWIMFFS